MSSQYVEGATKSFTAGVAIARYLQVIISTGKLALAIGNSTAWIGSAEYAAFADGDVIAVRLRNAQGTQKCVANSSWTHGAVLYLAAGGMLDDTGSVAVGIALEDAGAQGDVVEWLPY